MLKADDKLLPSCISTLEKQETFSCCLACINNAYEHNHPRQTNLLLLPSPCLDLLFFLETAMKDPRHSTYAGLCWFVWLHLNFPPVLYFWKEKEMPSKMKVFQGVDFLREEPDAYVAV